MNQPSFRRAVNCPCADTGQDGCLIWHDHLRVLIALCALSRSPAPASAHYQDSVCLDRYSRCSLGLQTAPTKPVLIKAADADHLRRFAPNQSVAIQSAPQQGLPSCTSSHLSTAPATIPRSGSEVLKRGLNLRLNVPQTVLKAVMKNQANHVYEFGPFRISATDRLLLRDGRPVPLTSKAFDTLLVLVHSSGHLVEKGELMDKVWPDTFVEEGTLVQNIFTLRRVLGEGQGGQQYIETIPKRGYCFIAPVKALPAGSPGLILEENTVSNFVIEDEESIDFDSLSKGGAVSARRLQAAATAENPWQAIPTAIKRKRGRRMLVPVGAVVLLAIAGFGLYKLAARKQKSGTPAGFFQTTSISKLTRNGKSVEAAISPDAKYVAYVLDDAGGQSLWLRQTAGAGEVQIVPPDEGRYLGLTFSRDSNLVYYVKENVLYRTPALGGASQRLISGVGSAVALSPDGKRLAFVRGDTSRGESTLIIATLDGGQQTALATRKPPDYFRSAAWSPDGKTLACCAATRAGDRVMTVLEIDLETGHEKPLASKRWYSIGGLAWISDGTGLVVAGRGGASSPAQIWHVAYPSGEARPLTTDLTNYGSAGLSSDSRTMVAVQHERRTNLWVVPNGDAGRARQLTTGTGNDDHPRWTPDGLVVFSSEAGGSRDIWIAASDGSSSRQLTFDSLFNHSPAISPDGRYIVFVSERGGARSLWRMNVDGTNLRQLTSDAFDLDPCFSADGKWVVYASYNSGKPTLWKVSVEGGDPVRLTDKLSRHPVVSPDGRYIAYYHWDEQPNSSAKIAVIPFAGGPPVRTFDFTGESPIEFRWTPDGKAITYVVTESGVSNIWSQPLSGDSPRRLTDFKSDRIFFFDWSRDGKNLVCSRGAQTSDVVLVGDQR